MGGHPSLEVAVGGIEFEIVEGVIAVVERGAAQAGAGVKVWSAEEKQEYEWPANGSILREEGQALGELHFLFQYLDVLRANSSA
jgi:hypothetical protein